MLTPKLQQIKDRIASKASYLRTDGEKELLNEITLLEEYLERKYELAEFRESVRKYSQITSGPGGSCPCCGK